MTVLTWTIEKDYPTVYMQIPDLITSLQPQQVQKFVRFDEFDLFLCLPGIMAFLFIGIIDVSGVIFGKYLWSVDFYSSLVFF